MSESHSLSNPTIIADAQSLSRLAALLSHEPSVALDTESNSLYAYRERVCLIQVSTRAQDWVIDPLALDSLEPLRPILANPAIEKVFHAAEYDLLCMKRDYGFEFANLFDTMFAARVLGRKSFGLGALLEEFFGVQADKRFQRADWSKRPIPADQLQYAQQDTHYLLELRGYLWAELEASGRLSEAQELFEALTHVTPTENPFDEEGYWRMNAARDFTRRQMAILRELYLWRDSMAQRQDVPPFKVMGDGALIALVVRMPRTVSELHELRDISSYQIRRYAQDLLGCIDLGIKAPPPPRPERPRAPDPVIQARYDLLHQWRKDKAALRGVESDIILSKESMWAMARTPPTTLDALEAVPALGPWRREQYGEQLIQLFAVPETPALEE